MLGLYQVPTTQAWAYSKEVDVVSRRDRPVMSDNRKDEVACALSEFDMLALDWFVSLGDNEGALMADVIQAVGIPEFVGRGVMIRLVSLGLITTKDERPKWGKLAYVTQKGRDISTFYNSPDYDKELA